MENIDTAEYGAEIAVDGMPAWLRDDEQVMAAWGNVWFSGGATLARHYADPERITAIRLPADHWAYPVIAAGFEPWGGGDNAPAEGPVTVMFGNGHINDDGDDASSWYWTADISADAKIIGYKRKVAPGSEMWSAATVYEPGDVVRISNGGTAEAIEEIRAGDLARFETVEKLMDDLNGVVTIPTMTEEEAVKKAEDYCDSLPFDRGYVQALRDLGLIRPATLLDQFEAHHGGLDDNQRAIIEIYQEWVAGL